MQKADSCLPGVRGRRERGVTAYGHPALFWGDENVLEVGYGCTRVHLMVCEFLLNKKSARKQIQKKKRLSWEQA